MTADAEHMGHHTSDLDRISDGMLDAATHNTMDYDAQLALFRTQHPAIYYYLIANMHNRGDSPSERARMFRGVLDIIGLLEAVHQTEELRAIFDNPEATEE